MNNIEKNGYKNFPVTDTHFHFAMPGKIEDAVNIFSELSDYLSLERITLLSLTHSCHRELEPLANLKALYLKERLNERREGSAFAYGSLLHNYNEHDSADGYLSQAEELYGLGVDGYKMLEGKAEERKKIARSLCDPIFDKMYAFIEEHEMPLKMHVADPRYFWGPISGLNEYEITHGWWYGDGSYPSFEQLHSEVEGVLEKFPRLKLCLAHFGYLADDISAAERFMEKWENVSFDLTLSSVTFRDISDRRERARQFFTKYRKRLFFGTDTYNRAIESLDSAAKSHNFIRRMLERPSDECFEYESRGIMYPLGLDDGVLRDVYTENHKRLHASPRSVSYAAAARYAEGLAPIIFSDPTLYGGGEELLLEKENYRVMLEYFKR